MKNERGPRGAPATDPWTPEAAADVLLVTRRARLVEEVERIAAAASVTVRAADGPDQAGAEWERCRVVLVGADIRELPAHRRPPGVLLGLEDDAGTLWSRASVLGAERVVVLPEGARWLADFLSRRGDTDTTGVVLAVTGGCGGAGASTIAAWLAARAAAEGFGSLLIDGDPWGGGLELALSAEELPGLRWEDFLQARGTIDPRQLHDSLPMVGGFSLLSWGTGSGGAARGPARPEVLAGVLDAARRGFELTVVDAARSAAALERLAFSCDRLLVVVPGRVRAAVAAAQVLRELPTVRTGLIVRGPLSAGLDAELIADSIGHPLAGYCAGVRAAPAATEAGQILELRRRRAVQRFTGAVLATLDLGRPA
ncbi:hypothetical protein KIH31_01870 [Paenarthrobacter sp. DKR-5]|uniref:septum site-determining protein Ssd n=1 Tax=Paenarthrobacter sp. DKR-5 TaxID=2835535 RepID=UPI001BDCC20B|nr:septum site-determining protein Ssd [Paenarthrobacter sp. DKR-5]MBT1001338.1 hypothetical protein [Paenarthrobacter sp. DKR-5]